VSTILFVDARERADELVVAHQRAAAQLRDEELLHTLGLARYHYLVQEKESELASIAAQRSKFVDEQLDRLQEQDRKNKEEINKLKAQLKQLTKDFQYNLQLLNDRDTELELLEKQVEAHKEAASTRGKVRPISFIMSTVLPDLKPPSQ
jgi:chromosome segregation ATPase